VSPNYRRCWIFRQRLAVAAELACARGGVLTAASDPDHGMQLTLPFLSREPTARRTR
jgi:hypothetical protein